MDGLFWLLLLTGLLMLLQRGLHREIQAVFLLITRRADISRVLFSVLFFPGILLHETSHFVMAHLLRVRTGHFSLIPRQLEGGRVQLGYVETARADIFRDALIGAAPLLTGGLVIAYIGVTHFGLTALWQAAQNGNGPSWIEALSSIIRHPDFWLWLYLAFVVSSTMLPSQSDRRAWLPIVGVAVLLALFTVLVGGGPWLKQNFAPELNGTLRSVAVVFAISDVIHSVLLPPFLLFRLVLERATGLKVA